MLHKDEQSRPLAGFDEQSPDTIDDQALASVIEDQRASMAASERAFIQAREQFDRQRRRLRALEEEQERRRLRAVGQVPEQAPEKKARRKRSTTGMDALYGRDGIEPDLPFAH